MSWLDEAIPMLRILIADISDPPEYSDERLEELLTVSAKLVNQELTFDWNYVVSVSALTVTPDPLDNSDDAFINFSVMKAACIADQGKFRARALMEGIRIQCGPGSLGVSGNLSGFETLLDKGPCETYKELAKQYSFGDRLPIRAVMSPFVSNNFDPSTLGGYYNNPRDRFIS